MKPESLKLVRVTLFVENLETQTSFYRDKLNLPPVDVRAGWSEFGDGEVTIALHRGKGRKPRLEFETECCLEDLRACLAERGVRLGVIKEVRAKRIVVGKDKDGNTIQISERAEVKTG